MNAPSYDIKDMLEAESSLGLTFGSNLFYGREPESPNNCVTIFDTVGYGSDITLDQKSIFNPSVQVRVRNIDYDDGWTLIKQIEDVLNAKANEVWNSTMYLLIQTISGPAFMDWDENNRVRFVINFNLKRR